MGRGPELAETPGKNVGRYTVRGGGDCAPTVPGIVEDSRLIFLSTQTPPGVELAWDELRWCDLPGGVTWDVNHISGQWTDRYGR